MSRDLLAYWRPETADVNLARGGWLDHAASDQFGSVRVGDTVWIVTARSGSLFLLGRILVGRVTDKERAAKFFKSNRLWDAEFHILSVPNTAVGIQEIALGDCASQLRFQMRGGVGRLDLSTGRANPQQLQRLRTLTPESSTLLQALMDERGLTSKRRTASRRAEPTATANSSTTDAPRDDPRPILRSLRRLQAAGRKSLDLVKPEYRDVDRSEVDLNGLCYVLSECLYHLYPTQLTPFRLSWGYGTTHWFLRFQDGKVLDAISENGCECCDAAAYARARRVAFFTTKPSKRAKKLFKRAGFEEFASE